jgi:hypothetical protein
MGLIELVAYASFGASSVIFWEWKPIPNWIVRGSMLLTKWWTLQGQLYALRKKCLHLLS